MLDLFGLDDALQSADLLKSSKQLLFDLLLLAIASLQIIITAS